MIQELLRPPVVGFDGFRVPGRLGLRDGPGLLPGEESAASAMSPARRLEFTAVRGCAREGLRRLGVRPAPILRGPAGEPLWPAGVVGSMTHCSGYHAAAVAPADEVAAVGIDAEVHAPLRYAEMLGLIATPEERARISGLTRDHPQVHWDRLAFVTKESVFKAWFALTGRPLGPGEIVVHLDPSGGHFRARPRTAGGDAAPDVELSGRWAVRDGVLLAAVTVPRAAARRYGHRAATRAVPASA
ncbi:4'-phosphopantetheinyl transferase [Streptomyces sp. NPDC056796]|uniref:4'-phosphopantetheinyl transferase family protein n=1 Tax=Streptomyces sp. NPDC056796 TaxID=3345947 RepID=UPI003694026C